MWVLWMRQGIQARTLVVVYDIAQMIATAIVSFSHAHGVVSEVDIAVVAFEELASSRVVARVNLQKSAYCVSLDDQDVKGR